MARFAASRTRLSNHGDFGSHCSVNVIHSVKVGWVAFVANGRESFGFPKSFSTTKMPQSPESGLFWHDQGNVRYTSHTVAGCLVDILRRAGIKPPKGKSGPRIHDLRHSFVVNRILEWYRAGINPQDKLPFLATYLGHRDIHSTLVYITVTQELLQQANERFRTFASHCLHASEGVQP